MTIDYDEIPKASTLYNPIDPEYVKKLYKDYLDNLNKPAPIPPKLSLFTRILKKLHLRK